MSSHKLNLALHQNNEMTAGFFSFLFAPIINLLCLLLMFLTVIPLLVAPTSVHINLPKTMTSDAIPEVSLTIAITSEDLIFFQNKIVTDKELKQALKGSVKKNQPILIKADRRSSFSRIIDVWNVCRELELERVNIATTINK